MFEVVTTKKQQKQFETTWEYFCDKFGWVNDPYTPNGIRYTVQHPDNRKKVIGTIEFTPYSSNIKSSTVEKHFAFASIEMIMQHQARTWEIDKLCLHKDFHRMGLFREFISIYYHHAIQYQPKYYVGMMEKKFFRMARIVLGLKVIQLGEDQGSSHNALVPVLLDIETIMKDKNLLEKLLADSGENHQQNKKSIIRTFIGQYKHYFQKI